jgi:Lipocalin-like domain
MNRRSVLSISVMTALGLVVPSGHALGQTAKDLVGTWTWASVDLTRTDGTKTQPFGANPKGYVIFDSNGRFAYLLTRADRPKFAANNREQGTPEENKESVLGVLAYSGRYSVTDGGKTLIFHIEASSYPNAEGVDQKRSITLTEDELKWTNPAPTVAGGGTAHTALRRVK